MSDASYSRSLARTEQGGQKEGARAEAPRAQKENHMLSNVAELIPASKDKRRLSQAEVLAVETERMRQWVLDRVNACQSEPVLECVTLTPTLARVLLERNDANRAVSAINVDRIKRDIEHNLWEFNGEPIIISKDGFLNDGQHRCRAVIEAGQSIRMVIVFGPQRQSRLTLDQGVNRTTGHYLSMLGHTDPNALAAVAACIFQYKAKGMLSNSGADKPTKSECREIAETTKGINQSLTFASRAGSAKVASRSVLAFCHWAIAKRAGMKAADQFIDQLLSGYSLEKGNPILYARERLMAIKGKLDLNEKAELIFRAYNLWCVEEKNCSRIPIMGARLPKLETPTFLADEAE